MLGVWAASPLPEVLPNARSVAQQHTSNAPRNCHLPVDSLCSLLNTFQRAGLHSLQKRDQTPHLTLTLYCRGGSRCQSKETGYAHPYPAATHHDATSNYHTKMHLTQVIILTDLKSLAGRAATFPLRKRQCWCMTVSHLVPQSLRLGSPSTGQAAPPLLCPLYSVQNCPTPLVWTFHTS